MCARLRVRVRAAAVTLPVYVQVGAQENIAVCFETDILTLMLNIKRSFFKKKKKVKESPLSWLHWNASLRERKNKSLFVF